MTTQPEALRLADALMETHPYPLDIKQAAAELRRLHAENECIRSALNGWIKENSPGGWIDDLRTQRDALLEALKYHQEQTRPIQRTLDVIKWVEEGK